MLIRGMGATSPSPTERRARLRRPKHTGGRSLVVSVAGFPNTAHSLAGHCQGGGATPARRPPLLRFPLPRPFTPSLACLPAASFNAASAAGCGPVGASPKHAEPQDRRPAPAEPDEKRLVVAQAR